MRTPFKSESLKSFALPAETHLPPLFPIILVILTILPLILWLCGVDVSSDFNSNLGSNVGSNLGTSVHPPYSQVLESRSLFEAQRLLSQAVAGPFLFILTHWSAFCLALMTAVLALFHLGFRESRAMIVIALSLLLAGMLDAFHALVMGGWLPVPLSGPPFAVSLAMGRTAVAATMVLGLGLIFFPWGPVTETKWVRRPIGLTVLGFVAIATLYGALVSLAHVNGATTHAKWLAAQEGLRFLPLLIYALPGAWIFWRFYRRERSIFSHSLLLAVLPLCAMEAHLAFGSERIFDSHFNFAQYLKIVSYSVPLGGILLDYLRTQRRSALVHQLQVAQSRLLDKTRDLERANLQLAWQVERSREFEAKLTDSETCKATILASALDAIVSIDGRGAIVDANTTAKSLFGLDLQSQAARASELLPARYRKRYLSGAGVFEPPPGALRRRRLIRLLKADGTEFRAEIGLTRIRSGGEVLYTAFVRDVTELQRYRRDLVSAREEAIRASQAKSEFLANMSHEIRTPLNAILGMTDLMAEANPEGEFAKCLAICRRAGRTLLNIVNDVLDLSKIEAGQLRIETIDFDLHALVEDVAEIVSLRALEKDISFSLHIRPDVPRLVRADPTRLRQVLLNLTGNAIKFTAKGEVSMKVEVLREPQRLSIRVLDTGIGIPETELEHVFEKFAQADSSITRLHGGTGLGLSISKRLVEAMGGRIRVRSRVGMGSEFRIEIPVDAADPARDVTAEIFIDLQGRRALIVDESAARRAALRDHLESWGAAVTEVSSVDDAWSVVGGSDEPFDLAFVGSHRMERGEAELSKYMRGRGCAPVRLAAEAGGDGAKDAVSAAVLPQPITRADLIATISLALGLERPDRLQSLLSAVEAKVERESPKVEPAEVLLVEDSPDNRALVLAYLRSSSVKVTTAENGADGLKRFCADGARFDLVLMDMQMPIMDGYTATREFRAWERSQGSRRTPILALTAHALSEEIRKTLDAGCDGHLSKPVKKSQLLEAIRVFAAKTHQKTHQRSERRRDRNNERQNDQRAGANEQ